jgi:GTP-binding protein Era
MQHRVELELAGCDAVLMVLNAYEGIGPGDRYIAESLKQASIPVIVAVNKIDRLNRAKTVDMLLETAALGVGEDIFPISAKQGTGVEDLVAHLTALVPEGPFFFPVEDHSDQPLEVHLAELVREQVLRRTFQEVPHSVEVQVDELDQPKDDLTVLRALVWVETDSQKGILIGAGGAMIKQVGTAARRELERELGTRVHLDLAVRVKRGWRGDERLLDRLGIE